MTRQALITLAALLLTAAPASAEPQRAAFFGITFINTTEAPSSPAELERTAMIEARLVQRLGDAGRFSFIDIAPVAAKADRYVNLAHCNGCDSDLARELGADVAITGELQKTSNLILHITLYVRDAQTGALVGGGSTDIRGNTDETWTRGVDWLVKNRLLKP